METGKRRQDTEKGSLISILGALLLTAFGLQHPVPGIKVENTYVRTAAQGMESAAYFKISNASSVADTLYDVKASFAEMAMLHESFRKNGMVGMKEVEHVVVPAESSVVFKPGGYHVMLMNVKQDLKTGMKVHLQLIFRRGGKIEVDAPVK